MIDEKLLEVQKFEGSGYKPQVDFNGWRVAVLNYIEEIEPKSVESMERHLETDEVFVLTHGKGILFLGRGDKDVEGVHTQVMEPGVIYNVKARTWHTVVLTRDGSVTIVENTNTNESNSEKTGLQSVYRQFIQDTAASTYPGAWE